MSTLSRVRAYFIACMTNWLAVPGVRTPATDFSISLVFVVVSCLYRSFAYLTVKDRLPTILTKVIDTIHRNKNKFFEEHGEV